VHPILRAECVGADQPGEERSGADGSGAHDQGVVVELAWRPRAVDDVEDVVSGEVTHCTNLAHRTAVVVDVDASCSRVGEQRIWRER